MKVFQWVAAVAVFSLFSAFAMSAETVNLFLKANGADVQGESTVTSLGRANSIECLFFQDAVEIQRQAGTALATGRRTYEPIVIRKRIDKSTPLLARALTNNERIEGAFRFYRPNPAGDGTTQHFFTVDIKEGRIASIKRLSPSKTDPQTANQPVTEEIAITFTEITWTYHPTSAAHTDSMRGTLRAAPTTTRPPTRPPAGNLIAEFAGLTNLNNT